MDTRVLEGLQWLPGWVQPCPLHWRLNRFYMWQIPRTTLSDRAKGHHDSGPIASAKRQLLSPEQEDMLVRWCELRALIGEAWSSADLCVQDKAISGKKVGQNWHRKFEKWHPELHAAKPAKLDPKRAKHFNKLVIGNFYDKWEALNAKHNGIPPEHIWNFDEKGIQMGGGRKKSSKKYYFLKDQKDHYCIWSDNLELVAILKCISAGGDAVPPSFCLQNGSRPDLWELSNDEWGRFGCFILVFVNICVLTSKWFKHIFLRIRMDWQLQCGVLAWQGFHPLCKRATCWSIQNNCYVYGWAQNTQNSWNAACSL